MNGGIPLADHAGTASQRVSGLDEVPSRIDIRRVRAHRAIHFDAASTGDSSAFHKVDDGFNTDPKQDCLTGDVRPGRGNDAAHLAVLANDLGDFLLVAHIDPVALLLLQHKVRGGRVQHL